MWMSAYSLHGEMSPNAWTEFIKKLTLAIGMTPNGEPAAWQYPTHCGAGGSGQTILQAITESFIVIDTWPFHKGAYILICSCKPFELDPLYALIREYKLEIVDGDHHRLKLAH